MSGIVEQTAATKGLERSIYQIMLDLHVLCTRLSMLVIELEQHLPTEPSAS